LGAIISIVNQKGGVAKTTTAINLAAAMGEMGKRILLVDLDPQGNATTGYGIGKKELKSTTYEVIMGLCRPADAVLPTGFANVSVIPATQQLAESEIRLLQFENKTLQLRKALSQLQGEYDYIIIDCLPSLGVLALNGLCASNRMIIPMQCEPYSLEGVAELMATVRRVKRGANRSLTVMGIVFTMMDKRLTVNREVQKSIQRSFPKELIFDTEIPRNVRIAEAPSHGKPIIYYDDTSKGAEAYRKLAQEVTDKIEAAESTGDPAEQAGGR
jgi:chromosome partitioning protein